MRTALTAIASLAALAGANAYAQTSSAAPAAASAAPAAPRMMPAPLPLALTSLPAKGGAKLSVTSPAYKDGGQIPLANSGWGDNKFPGLSWKGAPKGTKSFAVIMQDSDPPAQYASILTILHWTMFNVPASVTSLAADSKAPPAGAVDGANFRLSCGCPVVRETPVGGPPHHYHLQVFALDTTLALADGAKVADIIASMKDHVLASGELVGTYQGPATAPVSSAPAASSAAPASSAPKTP